MVGEMNRQIDSTQALLQHGWEVHPTVVLGCVVLIVWHLSVRPRNFKRDLPFLLGVLVLALSLISPIDPLGDQYLFSAHMLQHLLLILIVPPLLIMGISPDRVFRWREHNLPRRAEAILGRPAVAWTGNILIMAVWHIPALYNLANAVTAVHVFEHLTFLVTGCMFWWPIFTPIYADRLQPGQAMLYLFGAAAVSTVLGILITFLPVGYYQPYLHPSDEFGALHLVRDTWGISAAEDEKLAGLLMWVPGCTIYFLAMLLELSRWYGTPDPDKQALMASHKTRRTEVHHG